MSKKLKQLEARIEKAHARREAIDLQIKELEGKYAKEQDKEILAVVKASDFSMEEVIEAVLAAREKKQDKAVKENSINSIQTVESDKEEADDNKKISSY